MSMRMGQKTMLEVETRQCISVRRIRHEEYSNDFEGKVSLPYFKSPILNDNIQKIG